MASSFTGSFSGFDEFARALSAYEAENNVVFRKHRSETIEYANSKGVRPQRAIQFV